MKIGLFRIEASPDHKRFILRRARHEFSGLFDWRHRMWWEDVGTFKTREGARQCFEEIKDLDIPDPEYLPTPY